MTLGEKLIKHNSQRRKKRVRKGVASGRIGTTLGKNSFQRKRWKAWGFENVISDNYRSTGGQAAKKTLKKERKKARAIFLRVKNRVKFKWMYETLFEESELFVSVALRAWKTARTIVALLLVLFNSIKEHAFLQRTHKESIDPPGTTFPLTRLDFSILLPSRTCQRFRSLDRLSNFKLSEKSPTKRSRPNARNPW